MPSDNELPLQHDPTEEWRGPRRPYWLLDVPNLEAEAKALRLMQLMERAHRDRQTANKLRTA